jgi:flagellar protein FliS
MYGKNPLAAYQAVQVTTTDRGRLLLMLYEGAIKFFKQAKAGLEGNDVPKFCRFLSKGQAIVAELLNTLDYEKGGTIARDLERLYEFMLFYSTEANMYRDPKRIQKVIELLDTIYSGYKEIIEGMPSTGDVGAPAPVTAEVTSEADKQGSAAAPPRPTKGLTLSL